MPYVSHTYIYAYPYYRMHMLLSLFISGGARIVAWHARAGAPENRTFVQHRWLPPEIEKKHKATEARCAQFTAVRRGLTAGSVTDASTNATFSVNLDSGVNWTQRCSCGVPVVHRIPCEHMLSLQSSFGSALRVRNT